jgi:hypothetical protein
MLRHHMVRSGMAGRYRLLVGSEKPTKQTNFIRPVRFNRKVSAKSGRPPQEKGGRSVHIGF